jgi:hypothetical protein
MTEKISIGKLCDIDSSFQSERLNRFKALLVKRGHVIKFVKPRHTGYSISVNCANIGEKFTGEFQDCSVNCSTNTFFLYYKRTTTSGRIINAAELVGILGVMLLCLYIQVFVNPDRYHHLAKILPFVDRFYSP